MSTIEDFRNAPAGATATHKVTGGRAMKMANSELWIRQNWADTGHDGMGDYTLDPSAPTTAREALDLAWELAHPVKPGQVIPKGTRYLAFTSLGLREYTACVDREIRPELAPTTRTLEPLPDPEPDWLDAPAAYARCGYCSHEDYGLQVTLHGPVLNGQKWECAECQTATDWNDLRNVVPLYPKEGQDA